MSVTVDCGEGKHALCVGHATKTYLFPQYDGEYFECGCPCHRPQRIYDACGELSELGVPSDVLAPIREYADSLVAGGTRP